MEVLSLLRSKNRCLLRLIEESEAALKAMDQGDFSALTRLEERRESILKAFELYDRKLTQAIQMLRPEQKTPELRADATVLARQGEEALAQVLGLDEKVMARINDEKLRLSGEIAAVRKTTQNVNKFKSQWVSESGEEIDKKL